MIRLLTAALFGLSLAGAASAQALSPDAKAEIDAQIRAYILEHPEVIVEAMQVLEQRQQAEAGQDDARKLTSLRDEILNDGYSHVAGNPDGDVTMVEFLDYRCGYCKQAHDGVKALVAADSKLRLVIKEFPILGPESTYAARAAMAAIAQGGALYMAFNDVMMRHRGDLDQATVARLAAEAGLDVDRLTKDMEAPEIAENIRRTYALARQLEINGTPGFIIGDKIIRGYIPYDDLRELVKDARESS